MFSMGVLRGAVRTVSFVPQAALLLLSYMTGWLRPSVLRTAWCPLARTFLWAAGLHYRMAG